jgi:hypothetical protein
LPPDFEPIVIDCDFTDEVKRRKPRRNSPLVNAEDIKNILIISITFLILYS